MKYNKASVLVTVHNPHAHLFMDTSTSSTWDMSMGNHFLLDNLPYELPYTIEDPLQPHETPSSGLVPNSSIQTPHVPSSSVQTHHIRSSYHVPISSSVQTLHHAPSSSTHEPSSSYTNGSMGNQGGEVDFDCDEEEGGGGGGGGGEEEEEGLGPMKEMMYKIAAMQPVDIDPATIRKPKRRNVRISHDPQSVAARHRRERISERIRILQRLVPGGTKMDTASMLDEAIRYVKFLKRQVQELQCNQISPPPPGAVGHLPPVDWPVRSVRPLAFAPSSSPSSIRPPGGPAFCFDTHDGTCGRML